MSGRFDNPLLQLQQAAKDHGLTMAVQPLPRTSRVRIQKSMTPGTIFAAGDYFWQIVGEPKNVEAFLKASAAVIAAYFAYRSAKSIKIKSGDIEVEIKGTTDYCKAIKIVSALKNPPK